MANSPTAHLTRRQLIAQAINENHKERERASGTIAETTTNPLSARTTAEIAAIQDGAQP